VLGAAPGKGFAFMMTVVEVRPRPTWPPRLGIAIRAFEPPGYAQQARRSVEQAELRRAHQGHPQFKLPTMATRWRRAPE